MTTIPHFRLSIASAEPAASVSTQMELDFSKMGALAQTQSSCGGFDFDRASGKFKLEWGGLAKFDMWRQDQERTNSIELRIAKTIPAGICFLWKRIYKCAQKGSPKDSAYQKKYPDQIRKHESKQIGCCCQVEFKAYPDTTVLLGHYIQGHNHPTNSANLVFTHVSEKAKGRVKELLEQGVERRKIVCNHCFAYKIRTNFIFRSTPFAHLLLTAIATNISILPTLTKLLGCLIGKELKSTQKMKSRSSAGWMTLGKRGQIPFARID